jgi:hypothetical protein
LLAGLAAAEIDGIGRNFAQHAERLLGRLLRSGLFFFVAAVALAVRIDFFIAIVLGAEIVLVRRGIHQ